MEREDDVIELGTATIETKGPGGMIPDGDLGQRVGGLTDE